MPGTNPTFHFPDPEPGLDPGGSGPEDPNDDPQRPVASPSGAGETDIRGYRLDSHNDQNRSPVSP